MVNNIVQLNDDYFVLTGNFSFDVLVHDTAIVKKAFQALLVRKNDGAIFDYGKSDFLVFNLGQYGNIIAPTIFKDDNNNLYYNSYDHQDERQSIIKISLKNPNNIRKEDYLPAGQNAYPAVVDNEGNVAYATEVFDTFRMKNNAGTISFIPGGKLTDYNKTFINECWTGNNKKIYVSGYDKGLPYIGIVNSGPNTTVKKVWEGKDCQNDYPRYCRINNLWNFYKIYRKNKVIFMDAAGVFGEAANFWEFNESDNSMVLNTAHFSKIAFRPWIILGKSDNYLFYRDETFDIHKLSLEDYSITSLSKTSLAGYSISSMKVYDDEVVEFTGMRNNDRKNIVARIDKNGDVKLISDQITDIPRFLFRIK